MSIHTRVGLVAGVIGCALLYLAQPVAGAAAVALLALVGLLAGLGTAKWLPRAWFGRQLEAGARAGVLACGLALVGFLFSLLLVGTRTTAGLAARSHLLGLDFGAAVRALGVVGWLGAGVVLGLAGVALGTAVGALASQLGAWDKNRHAIEVVKQAREAAQRDGRAATATWRSAPRLAGSLPPHAEASLGASTGASRATTDPPDTSATDASGDLAGLNESWHSLRSPLTVVPAPETAERPWTRYDERLPPGALLPDDLELDEPDTSTAATLPYAAQGANPRAKAGPVGWSDAAWRAGQAPDPAQSPMPGTVPTQDARDAARADEADGAESDNWLN